MELCVIIDAFICYGAPARLLVSEAAGASALVISPVVSLEVRPLFVSAAVGQVLPQQLARVDLSASASS